jgi:hypothetical protein
MNEEKLSLGEYLDQHAIDSDTVQQAYRYYLAEMTEDMSSEEMYDELVKAAGDSSKVDELLDKLENDSLSVENAALAVLSSAWDDPEEASLVESTIEDAKAKLPVIEVAIMAIVAMYGMYLISTGGIKKAQEVTIRRSDGGLEKRKTVEYASPTEPLRSIVDLFTGSPKG